MEPECNNQNCMNRRMASDSKIENLKEDVKEDLSKGRECAPHFRFLHHCARLLAHVYCFHVRALYLTNT